MANQPAGAKKGKTAKVKRPTPLKRDMQAAKRNLRNRTMKSRVRTAVRSFQETLQKKDMELSKAKLNDVYSILDKAAQKGAIKKNTSSRTKSRLAAHLSA